MRDATKLATVVLSTGAALASILSFVHSTGFLGTPSGARETVGDLGVTWVGLSPAEDTARAIGDTLHLAALLTDRRGTALLGASVIWSSADPEVASVDERGTVVARRAGATTITVMAGEHGARAHVVVRQRVSRVRITADSALRVGEGGRLLVRVHVLDARGYAIAGRAPSWHVADSAVATVDSMGAVSGIRSGHTTLTAAVEGLEDEWPLDVVALPSTLALLGGDVQRAAAGSALPEAVVVRVLSARGRGVAGVPVRFAPAEGGGALEPANATTDESGTARTHWRLGDVPGRQRALAHADGVDSTVVIVSDVEPTAANTRLARIDTVAIGRAGARLGTAVTIRVTDSLARALPDVSVQWSPGDHGTVDRASTRTDSLGEARARWTLGPHTGEQRLHVQAGTLRLVPPLVLRVMAAAGAPRQGALLSGESQRAPVGTALGAPIVIRITDVARNPIAALRVRVTPDAGTVADSAPVTDSLGRVRVRWTLGRSAGAQRLALRVDGLDSVVTVRATALARPAANLEFLAPPGDGAPGHALPHPLAVRVTDAYGNPVSDARVTFAPGSSAGLVAPQVVMTDGRGHAATRWTLGKNAGAQRLTATVRGTPAHGSVAVTAASGRRPSR